MKESKEPQDNIVQECPNDSKTLTNESIQTKCQQDNTNELQKMNFKYIMIVLLVIMALSFAYFFMPSTVKQPDNLYTGTNNDYTYSLLNEQQKIIYNDILNCIMKMNESAILPTTDTDDLDYIYNCILADYGELYWIKGYSYNLCNSTIIFEPVYSLSNETKERIGNEINDNISQITSTFSYRNDYEYVKCVYDYITQNIKYNEQTVDNQTIISAILNKESVCQGYAGAFQYFLKQRNIPCTIISGNSNGIPHAWNLVYLDHAYYYFDTTWAIASNNEHFGVPEGFVNYNWFALTTAELQDSHLPDVKFALPNCISTEDNYYVREKCYFPSYEQQSICDYVAKSIRRNKNNITIKLDSMESCVALSKYFIYDEKLNELCSDTQKYDLYEDYATNIIYIRVTD